MIRALVLAFALVISLAVPAAQANCSDSNCNRTCSGSNCG